MALVACLSVFLSVELSTAAERSAGETSCRKGAQARADPCREGHQARPQGLTRDSRSGLAAETGHTGGVWLVLGGWTECRVCTSSLPRLVLVCHYRGT